MKNSSPYIATPKRVASILQLILGLSVLLWLLFDPFMGEHFRLKEELILIQNLRGDETLKVSLSQDAQEKLSRNHRRFLSLPTTRQRELDEKAHLIEWHMATPFISKALKGVSSFLFRTPFITLLWIALSVFLPIACLKKVSWAPKATLLLPLLVLAYAYALYATAKPYKSPFPSEAEIVSFLDAPLGNSVDEQMEGLKKGWQLYLIHMWAKETPSQDTEIFKSQVESGEYAFNLSLAERKGEDCPPSILTILAYFFWNMSYSLIMVRQPKLKESLAF